jgi:DNA-binding winged helix-turn-helix (wHTH) protein
MTSRPCLALGPFRLDPADRLLSRDGRPVPLSPKAIDTLLVLVERRGRLVSKDDLLREVWPDTFVEENNLAQHISTLRRVLGEGLQGPVIETVPRRGYRFVGPVAELNEEDVASAPAGSGPGAPVSPGDWPVTPEPAPRPRRPAALWGLALLAPVLLVLLAAWRLGTPPAAPAVGRPSSASPMRVAVLPFANLGTPDENYFAAGMTEEITSRLAGLGRVAVGNRSRGSAPTSASTSSSKAPRSGRGAGLRRSSGSR